MWDSSIRVDYIAGLIKDAIANYLVNEDDSSFTNAIIELKKSFSDCSEKEIMDILNICVQLYSAKQMDRIELVLTAPDSFKVKALRTRETFWKLIKDAEKSLTITGYAVSEYFSDVLDGIIQKSQQGVYVRLYINDMEKQKSSLERLLAYRSRFLQIYEYQKQDEDKMAALHAKIIVSDAKRSLVSSANLSYHGMQGNIEMGFLIESLDKAKQIEEVLKEMVRMKVFCRYEGGII